MGSLVTIVFLVLWSAGWVIAIRLRRPPVRMPATPRGLGSIIIPARNEAHNLPRLLQSVFSQAAGPLEVLVVDDGSTDGTAEVARRHGAVVVTPPPLADGWRGKPWACHHGAASASGEWLVFMDADTWFEPGGLARVHSVWRGGALSVAPYHAVQSPYEDLSLFFNLAMVAGTVPNGLVGQFLIVGRDDYFRAGGHEAVKGCVLENFRLAGRMRAAGVAVECVPGKGMVSLRMYPGGLGELIAGWTKGFAAGAGGTPAASLALVVAWMSGLMLAPLMAVLGSNPWLCGAACLLGALQTAWISRRIGSFGGCLALLYPVPLVFFFGLFARSAVMSGKPVTWKGRTIDAD